MTCLPPFCRGDASGVAMKCGARSPVKWRMWRASSTHVDGDSGSAGRAAGDSSVGAGVAHTSIVRHPAPPAKAASSTLRAFMQIGPALVATHQSRDGRRDRRDSVRPDARGARSEQPPDLLRDARAAPLAARGQPTGAEAAPQTRCDLSRRRHSTWSMASAMFVNRAPRNENGTVRRRNDRLVST